MATKLTIVGLGGSLGRISKSRAALRKALEGAEAAGAQTVLLDLRELDLPMYNPDDDEPGEAATRVIESCYSADGLIWSSPLYRERSQVRSRTRSTGCTCSVLGSLRICTTR